MRFKIDTMIVGILAALALGLLLPVRGAAAEAFDIFTKVAIFALFFGYGARLSAAESMKGLKNWKLHLSILAITFIVFPLLSLPVLGIPDAWLSEPLRIGLIFMFLVPSTVQSSITFTSLAGGNVPAAVVAATASNVLGVLLTPLLVIAILPATGGATIGWQQMTGVFVQLLLPFILGQLSRLTTARFMERHKARLKYLDQAVIWLIVYGAFSDLAVSGVWRTLALSELLLLVPIVVALLAFMFWFTWSLGGWLRMPREDRIPLMFCGTVKSLATGVPMASVLFGAATVGVLVIPLMLYHQVQLVTCSIIAGRLSRHLGRPAPAAG